MALLRAFDGWQEARKKGGAKEERLFCRLNYLSPTTLRMIADLRKQFKILLEEIGFSHARRHHRHSHNRRNNKAESHAETTNNTNNNNKNEQEKEKGSEREKEKEEERGGTEEDILNQNSKNVEVVKAVICAGLYPNVVRVEPKKPTVQQPQQSQQGYKLTTKKGGEVFIHPSSTLFNVDLSGEAQLKQKMLGMQQTAVKQDGAGLVVTAITTTNADRTGKGKAVEKWLVYHEKVKTSKLYIRDATLISPFALLLFGGKITVKSLSLSLSLSLKYIHALV